MLKMAVITGFLSRTKDRFHEHNQPLDLDGKFKLMSEMEGLDGVEIVYPYEVNDAANTKAVLKKHKLKVAAVNVNVKAEPEFRNGGLTSLDKKIRNKAGASSRRPRTLPMRSAPTRSPAARSATATSSPSSTTTPWPGSN